MIDLKPYGAFVENTLRPLLHEFKFVIEEARRYGFDLGEENLFRISRLLFKMYLVSLICDVLKTLITIGSVCLVVYSALR